MIYKVYSVRDEGVATFGAPIFVRHLGEALRAFESEVQRQDERNMMWRHPEDFTLFELGTFDDEQALFECHKLPVRICAAVDYKQLQDNIRPFSELKA